MTLVEVMVSFLVLTVAVFMLSSTITASIAHTDSKRERAMAVEAAMNVLERMRAMPFEDLFALYNSVGSDDPGGPGSAPGKFFNVPGLDPIPVPPPKEGPPPPNFVGEIILPGPGPELIETLSLQSLGLPRDLNGDLAVRSDDVAKTYKILPVLVRLRWQGSGGPRTLEIPTIFSGMEKLR